MNALNCLRVVELSNTQSIEREDKACCKLTQHFLIGFMYGYLLRMRTFFYNLQLQRVLISEAGMFYPRKRFSQYCVN